MHEYFGFEQFDVARKGSGGVGECGGVWGSVGECGGVGR